MLIITTACAVWVAMESNRARRQRLAVGHLSELGGRITYQHEIGAAGARAANPVAPGPHWLRRQFGGEYFDKVHSVHLGDTEVSDRDLELLAGLPDIRELSLYRTSIGDEGMRHLAALRRLEHLEIDGSQVTDASIDVLLELNSLKSVSLFGTGMSRSGVERLLDAGLQVYCMFDCEVAAASELRGEDSLLSPGKIPISGTFHVPNGAKLRGAKCLISIVAYLADDRPVIFQQGSVTPRKLSGELYSFDIVLHLKGTPSKPTRGAITVKQKGIEVGKNTAVILQPAATAR